MKVTRPPVSPVAPGTNQGKAVVRDAQQTSASRPIQQTSLADVASRLEASGEVDMEKVSAIRDAIASGKLPLDLDRLADAMLTLHRP